MKSDRELAQIEEKLRQINQAVKIQATQLRELILHEVRNGGFQLGNVWRIKALGHYSYREIVNCCRELEAEGNVQFNSETFTYIAVEED